ncbi:MAG: hypothetical protein ACYTEZ_06175 [Planctomycetota bacterium]|jgi:hypothetical protein
MRVLVALTLLGRVLVAESVLEQGKVTDAFWNFTYVAPRLSRVLAPGDPAVLFSGRCLDTVFVVITVREGAKREDGRAWRKRRKAAWKEKGRPLGHVTEGDTPQPWVLCTEPKYGVFDQRHGYAFHARGYHCFEVHAWVNETTDVSDERIRTALAGLALGEDGGCGLLVRRAALKEGGSELDPKFLLAGGIEYLTGRVVHPRLAAAVLDRARRRWKPETLPREEEWRLHFSGGEALLASDAAAEAIAWFERAEAVARKLADPERARQSAYNLARACSVAGRLDQAFAALDRAFDGGLVVSKARLSTAKELGNVRKDPRWEKFWVRRIAGQ